MTSTEQTLRQKCAVGASDNMTELAAALTGDELALLTSANLGLLSPLPFGYARDRYHGRDARGVIRPCAVPPAAMGQAYAYRPCTDREILAHCVAAERMVATQKWNNV